MPIMHPAVKAATLAMNARLSELPEQEGTVEEFVDRAHDNIDHIYLSRDSRNTRLHIIDAMNCLALALSKLAVSGEPS